MTGSFAQVGLLTLRQALRRELWIGPEVGGGDSRASPRVGIQYRWGLVERRDDAAATALHTGAESGGERRGRLAQGRSSRRLCAGVCGARQQQTVKSCAGVGRIRFCWATYGQRAALGSRLALEKDLVRGVPRPPGRSSWQTGHCAADACPPLRLGEHSTPAWEPR